MADCEVIGTDVARESVRTSLLGAGVSRSEVRPLRRVGARISGTLQRYYTGRDHPFKLRIWTLLRRCTGYPRLTVPFANDGWISVDERDWLQYEIFARGEYENEVWRELYAYSSGDDVVWDVGGHIGSFAIPAMTSAGIRHVHVFEPNPVSAGILRANLALNRGNATVHELALSHYHQALNLYHGPESNRGQSSLAAKVGHESFTVECRSADEIVSLGVERPTLMKIDVEDWELHVVQGAKEMLARHPPKAIVFESACDGNAMILERQIPTLLESYGYSVTHISRPSGLIEPRENYLAVRASTR